MAHVKKGVLKGSGSWAKHLRKLGKRIFWRRERGAGKALAKKEGGDGALAEASSTRTR